MPFVSVVIPCRNERRYIDACLTTVTAGEFPRDRLEVLVVDGASDDGTRTIVEERAAADPAIKLLDNPSGSTPAALNIGIRHAAGQVIVRIDAHCEYPPRYIVDLVSWLEKSGADNVGGVCRTRAANDSPKARAIAAALSHRFGVGNSYFRVGVREPRWVDTVPFGCYRRDVFDRIGLFDEDLVRNQDDELNARLIRRGGRILLVPDIVSDYFARESLGQLWRMYYQYGYFKPLVARKVGAVTTVRQILPSVMVVGLIGGAALAWALPGLRFPFALASTTYVAADLGCAITAARTNGVACVLWLAIAFPVLHVSYGIGFLKGMFDFVLMNRRPVAAARAMAASR